MVQVRTEIDESEGGGRIKGNKIITRIKPQWQKKLPFIMSSEINIKNRLWLNKIYLFATILIMKIC